jgi:dihydroorotase
MSMLIKNALIVQGTKSLKSDVLVCDGMIAAMGENLPQNGAAVVDAEGLWLLPGLIDLHCHLRDPGFEYKEDLFREHERPPQEALPAYCYGQYRTGQ